MLAMLGKMWDEELTIMIFWFGIAFASFFFIVLLKRKEVKKDLKMAGSLKTFWNSAIGKLLKSTGLILLTFFCTLLAIYFGAKEDTMIKIAAFIILMELGLIWRPTRSCSKRESQKTKGNSVSFKNNRPYLSRRIGRFVGEKWKRRKGR